MGGREAKGKGEEKERDIGERLSARALVSSQGRKKFPKTEKRGGKREKGHRDFLSY